MSDRVFYVGANQQSNEKIITGYVPAKFLTLNGKPVVDPVPGGSQKANIYADGSDKYKTSGAIANPNNYLIVPANYTEQQARAFAAHVAGTMDLGPIGQALALRRMKDAFWSNGSQDLQRHPQWGIPKNSFVRAFIDSASYHLGSVTRWAGLPETLSEIGGGVPHWLSPPPDKSDFRGLSQRNYKNISKGFSDGDVPRTAPSLMNNFGYNPRAQYPTGRIGDGNGLGVGDWRFAFAGVDPSHPLRPVPPLLTDSQPAPKLARVGANPVPAPPGSPVAPSDAGSLLGDRSGKWGSVSARIAPPPVSNRRDTFNNRFGSWGSVPVSPSAEAGSPILRALENDRNSARPDGAPSPAAPGAVAPTSLPIQAPAAGDRSEYSGNAAGSPVRRLSRRVINPSPAPTYDPVARAAPIAPFDEPNISGGLLGTFVALMGIDPQNPTEPPTPLDDQWRGFYRNDPWQPWFAQG